MPDPEPVIRISDSGELAASLPQLVGFRPRESLVAVSLRGPRARCGLTARVDLPPASLRAPVVEGVVRSLRTDRPTAVVLFVVSEAADVRKAPVLPGGALAAPVPELPHRPLVREAVQAFTRARTPVRDALLVRAERWWSYECAGPCCAPGAGTPLPGGTTALAAATALKGRVVEDDRAALAQRIAPVGLLAAAGMARACDDVGSALAVRTVTDGWEAVADESWQLVEQAAARVGRPGGERLTDREVARLAWGLREWGVRDRALGIAVESAAAEVLWTELTRRAPAPLDVAPATLLAVSAWVRGDGAMANVALERALAVEPSYPLAGLLRDALDACVPPSAVRTLVREVSGASRGARR